MKYGLPEFTHTDWYGLSPYPVCARGSICQYLTWALCRKSTNSYASFPRLPMPYFPGRDDMWHSIPALRSIFAILSPILIFQLFHIFQYIRVSIPRGCSDVRYFLSSFSILSTASSVVAGLPNAVRRKNPSPFLPKPAPGVPTTWISFRR